MNVGTCLVIRLVKKGIRYLASIFVKPFNVIRCDYLHSSSVSCSASTALPCLCANVKRSYVEINAFLIFLVGDSRFLLLTQWWEREEEKGRNLENLRWDKTFHQRKLSLGKYNPQLTNKHFCRQIAFIPTTGLEYPTIKFNHQCLELCKILPFETQ